MKRPQWIVAGIAFLLTLGLYALTQDKVFGVHPKKISSANKAVAAGITIDTILHHAKENLSPDQLTRINFLEHTISRGDVAEQKNHVFHQLARFWSDTAHLFEPFAWYTAEAARLENSEKSLTFAARLFLENLKTEKNIQLKSWKAIQAKDLFERSLKLNPTNDSVQVELGATYLFGGLSDNPMEGIIKLRKVAERDSTNAYAQMTLGEASLVSGQLDKAVERFEKVVLLEPQNLKAIFYLAEVYERKGNKKEAVFWYKRSLPLIDTRIAGLREDIEKRINELSK